MKQKRLPIFNVFINGDDIDYFCALSREEQFEWILKNTNQKNETLINEFLGSPIITENVNCIGCGKLNNKIENPNEQHNQPSGISETVAVDSETVNDSGNGKQGTRKRRADNKNS